MTDQRRDDAFDAVDDAANRHVVEMVRAAYRSDRLPQVGSELASVFTHGLPDHRPAEQPMAPPSAWPVLRPAAVPEPPARRASVFRRLVTSKAAVLTLGATAISVNLVGVGSAGLLPRPLQSGFERVTESVGIEIPRPTGTEPGGSGTTARPGESPVGSKTGAGTPGRRPGGSGGGGSESGGGGPSANQPQKSPPTTKAKAPARSDRTPGSPALTRPVPTTDRGRGGPTDDRPGGNPPTTFCIPAPLPGPTLPTVPAGPPTSLPVTPPGPRGGGPPISTPPAPPRCTP
jgi:hypothetical protein